MAQDEVLRQWGENIRLRRETLNAAGQPRSKGDAPMTQAQLGAALNPPVHQTTVARWEAGEMEPRRHFKAQLAALLATDVRILFTMTKAKVIV